MTTKRTDTRDAAAADLAAVQRQDPLGWGHVSPLASSMKLFRMMVKRFHSCYRVMRARSPGYNHVYPRQDKKLAKIHNSGPVHCGMPARGFASAQGALLTSLIAGAAAIGRDTTAYHRPTVSSATNGTTPLPPSQDPWYSAPANYSRAPPGTIFKIRSAPGVAAEVANTSAAYNILYRTTNSQYKAAWAVTTLLIPATNISCEKNKLLSYQIPYDSADVDASPSYALNSGGGYSGDSDITDALSRGWYVNVPDYEGPLASFTAGVQSGHATLDSVRAVLASKSGLKRHGTKIALWGYSGGALASEWGLELQVHGILGVSSQFPEVFAYLQSQLKTNGTHNATGFNAARNYTLIESIGAFAGQDIGSYFKNGVSTLSSPLAQKIIDSDGVMGYHGVPQSPLFVYKAIGDDISVVADTDELVARYCDVGATINYQRNTVGNHASESLNGGPRALAFLTKVLGGTYNATGCMISNVTVSV
nr:lipase a [Quercus suber]